MVAVRAMVIAVHEEARPRRGGALSGDATKRTGAPPVFQPFRPATCSADPTLDLTVATPAVSLRTLSHRRSSRKQGKTTTMAVKIRLARMGSKKRPYYRIVASDARSPRDGRFLERIGTYDPHAEKIVIDEARVQYWQGVGAHPTITVARLLRRARKTAPAAAAATK